MRSTTGHTFGAYASAPWHSAGDYINAAGCFLFLVENPHGDAPTCFEYNHNGYAQHGNEDYGPIFGGETTYDLVISSQEKTSLSNFPDSYTDTLGRGKATFTGANVFTAEDYEVWAVAPAP